VDWTRFDAPFRAHAFGTAYAFSEREYWLKHVPVLEEAPGVATPAQPGAGPQFYELAWQAQPPARKCHAGTMDRVHGRTGVGRALSGARGRWRHSGRRGSRERIHDDGRRFRIDPANPAHYERLLARLADESRPGSFICGA